ncbi:MAG: tyrosine decarboxylase MfnA [Thermoplasmata archaeon]|nr:tyrosine decarboxylase MfnA [Thermoplasmata archaeon]
MTELMAFYDKDLHYADGRILGSMCTSPDSISREAHSLFMEANLGNPGLCAGTAEMERRVIEMLMDLLGMDTSLPGNENAGGQMMSGGTEANITALWIVRNLTGKKEVIFPESAHFSLFKAVDLLGMRPKLVPLTREYRADVQKIHELLGTNTAAIVGIAGTTELGQVDPIEEIGKLAGDHGISLHVDAAFGGFVLPFLDDFNEVFDFRAKGVDTMGVDPHKMGLATIPAGALLMRDSTVQQRIAVRSPYLTTEKNMSLSGTRNSASVAAAYAVMRGLGREGYRRVTERCMNNTRHLTRKLRKMGLEPVIEPKTNVLAVRMENPLDVVREMNRKGWVLSRATHPPSLRFVVMPHVSREQIDRMVEGLEEVI